MNRYLYWVMPLLILALLASACGKADKTPPDASQGAGMGAQSEQQEPGNEQEKEPEHVKQKQTIAVYYTDDQLLELVAGEAEIEYDTEQEKLEAALAALKQPSSEGQVSLWQDAVFHSVSLKDGLATVDITLPDEARLGAPGEAFALEAIQKTLFQFEEVKGLELLLDGKPADTLMGHEQLEHPFTKNK